MARWSNLPSIWDNLKEMDLRPLREAALQNPEIAIVGRSGEDRQRLADLMRRDPYRPEAVTDSPLLLLDLDQGAQASHAGLVILLMDSWQADDTLERGLVRLWADSGRRILALVNDRGPAPPGEAGSTALQVTVWKAWGGKRVLVGPLEQAAFLQKAFVPAVLDLLPAQHLALGRQYPLFRQRIAHNLVNDTCMSNAAYALSTGLAEIVPVLDVPLNLADMLVLTKSQAFLVYKLGLALGYSTHWQDYVAEFSGVLGSGFVWRQVARSLVGLIPAWGIVPKVAVSFSGTYVVGSVVLQWYLTGRHVDRQQMRLLYVQAFERGKELARGLLKRTPRLPERKPKQLPPPKASKRKSPSRPCPQCGKTSAADAAFCQYCGAQFE